MPLEQDEILWLRDLTKVDVNALLDPKERALPVGSVLTAAEDADALRKARDKAFQEVMEFVSVYKGDMQAQLAKSVKRTGKDDIAFLNADKVDADTELDFVDDKGAQLFDDLEFERAREIWHSVLSQQSVKLEQACLDGGQVNYKGKGTRLFTNDEVRKEFWEPLVRERVIPSSLVFDDMSETMITFDAANAMYRDRLEEHSLKNAGKEGRLSEENRRLLGLVGRTAERFADAAGSMMVNIGKAEKLSNVDILRLQNTALVVKAVTSGAVKIAEVGADGEVRNRAEFCNKLTDIAASSAKFALTNSGHSDFATIAEKSIKTLGAAANFAASCSQKEPKGVMEALADAVSNAFSIAGAAVSPDDTDRRVAFSIASQTISAVIKQGASVPGIVKAWQSGDKVALGKAVTAFLTTAMTNVAATIGTVKTVDQAIEKHRKKVEEAAARAREDADLARRQGEADTRLDHDRDRSAEAASRFDEATQQVAEKRDEAMEKLQVYQSALAEYRRACDEWTQSHPGEEPPEDLAAEVERDRDALREADQAYRASLVEQSRAWGELNQDRGEVAADQAEVAALDGEKDTLAEDRAKDAEAEKAKEEQEDAEGESKLIEADETAERIAKALEALEGEKEDGEGGKDEGAEGEKDGAEEPEKARQAKIEAAAAAALAAAEDKLRLERLEADRKEMEALVRSGSVSDVKQQEATLKKIMEKMARDRAILQAADTLASGGAAIAAQFFPGTGAIVAFKEFLQQFVAAVQHTKLFREWRAASGQAKGAAFEALAAAELNRVGLEEKFMSEAWAMSVLSALETVGQSLAAAAGTPVQPAGWAIIAASKGAKVITQTIFDGIKEANLRKAWDDYQAALDDPLNRRAMRRALKANPTLAKYAVAWAAQVDNNPLARSILKGCGLTEAVLADKDSKATQVVAYMEMLFDKDPVVMHMVPVDKPWWPVKELELSTGCWTKFVKAAGKLKTKPLGDSAMGNVMAALARCEAAHDKQDPDGRRDWGAARADLIAALKTFKPVDREGEAHEEMAAVAKEFAKLAATG